MEKMVEASRSGLPVDVAQVPVPPQLGKALPKTLKPLVGSALQPSSNLALDKLYGKASEADSLVRQSRQESYGALEADLIRQVHVGVCFKSHIKW